jgi:two-component system, OmpR family, response regulator
MSTAKPARILVVDDEPEVRSLLRTFLTREGFAVTEAQNSGELFAALEHGDIDLITLDLGLGHEDGLVLARRIAATGIPIMMISGKGEVIDRVVGLELGAEDYISKPFNLREVLARIRVVLRRRDRLAQGPAQGMSATPGDERYAFAGWSLNVPQRRLVSPDGSALELTTAEFNLLLIFLRRPGRVLTRDTIMDLLKGHEWSPVDRTIDNLIGRLRKKIEPGVDPPQLIKTVRGVGYSFAGEVTRV